MLFQQLYSWIDNRSIFTSFKGEVLLPKNMSERRDFSFAQFKKDMSFLQGVLKSYFWALLFMASAPILVECTVIIYLVVKFSLEGRGLLAFGMGGCTIAKTV